MRTSTDLRTLGGDYSVDARRTGRRALVALSTLLLAASACSEGTTGSEADGTGGTPTAGASNAGVSTAGSSTAGASTGGAGGAAPSGGATTGGVGGASAATGGSPGGAGAGGTPSGGEAGSVGPAGAGGVPAAGNGGTPMAGNAGAPTAGSGGTTTAGTGGTAAGTGGAGNGGTAGKGGAGAGGTAGKGGAGNGGSGGMAPTMGCGAATWPTAGNKTITVGTTSRTYVMYVPTGYDTNRPYPVIFSWHGLTGSQGGFYSLNTAARAGASALMVSPQGLDDGMRGTGWWNENDEDLAFVDALITWLATNYCVDRNRLFSVGFSFGGMFSHLLGCERGDVFRAIAPIAGSFFSYYGGQTPNCDYPVPMIGIHGTADTSVTPASGRSARNVWLTENGCSMTTMPSTPTECVDYQGCMGENAVKWCEHPGTHMVPSFAADAIWNFFRQF